MPDIVSLLPVIAAMLGAGAVAGFLAGLFGIGGGIVTVPALALTFAALGYPLALTHHMAVATSLAIIIATGLSSAMAHHRRGAVMGDVLRLWAPYLVVASFIGGASAGFYSGDMLRLVFGVVALFLAINMALPLQQKLMGGFAHSNMAHRVSASVIAYVSALMGIGGGALSVPTLAAFEHSMQKAVGTSAAMGVVLAIPGAIGFVVSGWQVAGLPAYSLGFIYLPACFVVGLVATLVAPRGAAAAHWMPQKYLRLAFGLFLAVVGLRMIYQVAVGG